MVDMLKFVGNFLDDAPQFAIDWSAYGMIGAYKGI